MFGIAKRASFKNDAAAVESSSIAIASEINAKIAKAEAAVTQHNNAAAVQRVAIGALRSSRQAIVKTYQDIHKDAEDLLASL